MNFLSRISLNLMRFFFLIPIFFFINSCSSQAVPGSAGAVFNADFASRALNATINGAEAAKGLSTLFSALAQGVGKAVFGLGSPPSTLFSGMPPEITCSDGGTMTVVGFNPDDPHLNFKIFFSNCREQGIQIDGRASVVGTASFSASSGGSLDMIMTLGDTSNNLLIQNFQTVNRKRYGHLKSLFNANMTLAFKTTSDTPETYMLLLNGKAVYDDFFEKMDVVFLDFKSDTQIETGIGLAGETVVSMRETWGGALRESKIKADGLHLITLVYKGLTAVSVTTSRPSTLGDGSSAGEENKDVSYSGDFSIHFSSVLECTVQGDFSIETVVPFHYVDGAACPVSGNLTLRGVSGEADLMINGDKSLTVSAQGEVLSYPECGAFLALCAFENFQSGFLSKEGLPGTPAKGDRQFMTLTWFDTPSTLQGSDMDLHVGYYLHPAPAFGPANALVSWHSGGGDDCGSQRMPSLFGTVTAILDIDDCSAFGPEHATVNGLPAGYYVSAVNSFDLEGVGSTTVTVTVEVGKEVFTFPEKTFLLSDKDNVNPNAWYRVTDLQCFKEGECTFVAPNPALQVHDSAALF